MTHVAKKRIKLQCEPDIWKKRLISISFIATKKYFKNDLQGVIAELVPTPRTGAAEAREYGIKGTLIQIPRRLIFTKQNKKHYASAMFQISIKFGRCALLKFFEKFGSKEFFWSGGNNQFICYFKNHFCAVSTMQRRLNIITH